MSVDAQRHPGGQHDLDQAISMRRRRRSNRGRRFRRHRGRLRRRCRCRQFNRSKLHRRAGDHGARQAHQLLPPSVKLAGADPVFAGDLGCGQIRPQAFGDDLALLVGRPRPPRFSPGQNLDASLTSAPVITRTSALSFRDQVRRHHIHPQTRSYSGHEPPDVADAPLTQMRRHYPLIRISRKAPVPVATGGC